MTTISLQIFLHEEFNYAPKFADIKSGFSIVTSSVKWIRVIVKSSGDKFKMKTKTSVLVVLLLNVMFTLYVNAALGDEGK